MGQNKYSAKENFRGPRVVHHWLTEWMMNHIKDSVEMCIYTRVGILILATLL